MNDAHLRMPPALRLLLLALVVGVVAGAGAVLFRALIGLFHNLLFLGRFSFAYDANVHTAASPWGWAVVLVPVLGAAGVAYLVKNYAPEAKGHGVPEVIDAIYFNDARIRPQVAVVKSLASALSIGSGGSVGREGPIIQIGAAFGSTLGQWLPLHTRERAVLVAAGAGGGIAATFNTPLGGVVFAIELMLPFVTASTLLPVVVATLTATAIGRAFFGVLPSFSVPALEHAVGASVPVTAYPWFLLLGVIVGALAWAMTRGVYWMEDRFDALPGNYYTRHMGGMLLVGLVLALFMHFSPLLGQPAHYYVEGVGYATIMDILRGELAAPGFLALLVVAKLLLTLLTLGSGASGGIFSPAMFIGAAAGAAFGVLVSPWLPGVSPAHFALAAMAGMVGGTTGAVVTAVVMVFEMTRDYTVIMPMILTVAVAAALRERLLPATIYTLKLVRRGHKVPQGLQGFAGTLSCRDVMSPVTGEEEGPSLLLDAGLPLTHALARMQAAGSDYAVVTEAAESGGVRRIGVIGPREVARALSRDAHLAP